MIGDRECVYSDDVQTSSGRKVIEGQGKSRLLPSKPDQCDVSLTQQESKTLVKHKLLHSINDPKLYMSEPVVTVVDPDPIVHGEIGAIDVLETRFCSQPIAAILQQNEPLVDISLIVRCPTWDTDNHIGHFLAFHRASIVAGHYFWYFDFHQFCTTLLLEMAEQSISLRYAVAAFACLVYSVHADRNAKEFAFIYYAKAVHSLQSELNSASRNHKDQHFAILATALQLATVEVSSRLFGNADHSDSLLIRQNAFVIFRVRHEFFSIYLIPFNSPQPPSAAVFWSGISILRITAALFWRTKAYYPTIGGKRCSELDAN